MLYEVAGNLLTNEKINIFCHQTNCKGKMGAGIAKAIAEKYPIVSHENYKYCSSMGYSRNILGTNLYVKVSPQRTCVNMYAQYNYGRSGIYTEYDKFQSCLDRLAEKLNKSSPSFNVGFPAGIGCGSAGGDWNFVKPMIEYFSTEIKQNVYLVSYSDESRHLFDVTAMFIGNSMSISNEWHRINIQVLPKNYLVKCGNTQKFYSSKSSLLNDWHCIEEIELPDLPMR